MQWLERAKRAILGGTDIVSGSGRNRAKLASRRCRYEALEPRIAMAVAPGLTDAPQTYSGTLSGRYVFTSGGHGWQFNDALNRYATDRPEYWQNSGDTDDGDLIEDFGNQDQMSLYADYLLRAGATVIPMRPVGRQINEVVLDNDSAGVTYTGSWSDNTTNAQWYDEDYGAVADTVRYRFANVNAGSETATARYTPNIPQAGFYPVYTWVASSSNRTDQLYRINHTGGSTEIRVDHRRVGFGWVYLGTYHFSNGSSESLGSVQISNYSTAGGNVIADAIRFGNGMGDYIFTATGATAISGKPREDENSYHWIARSFGQTTGSSLATLIGTGNVSAPSNMAQRMYTANGAPFGQAVFVGFHSNGTTGAVETATGRGARGLIDSDQGTPNQTSLANILGNQINQDFQAQNGVFEVNWTSGTAASGSGGFGEIDLGAGAEMDATIIEVAFHDNLNDNLLLRDPKAREQVARSTYQGTLQYFATHGSPLATNTSAPTTPTNLGVVSNASGAVTLNWSAGPSTPAGVNGAAATSYKVYTSVDGYGFDGGTVVVGTSVTLTGYDPTRVYYFRVAALNAGGESKATEVLSALPSGGVKQILIVNGFDRFERTQNFRFAYPYTDSGDGLTDRVWLRYNNSFDYINRVHSAVQAARPGVHVASASNEAVIAGTVNLNDYQTVIWISGNESTSTKSFDATEQTKITQFLAAGGNLFLSGSEIGWDLDQQNNGRTFYENTLKSNYVSDDAGTYTATAAGGSIFAGLGSFAISNGAPSTGANAYSTRDDQVYDVATPDVIAPLGGAISALSYSGGTGGTAATQFGAGGVGSGSIVMFGFPFETMTNATRRNEAMGRILGFFGYSAAVAIETRVNGEDADAPTGPPLSPGSTATFTYIVTASGNLPVSNVVVKDDNGTPANLADDVTLSSPTGDANANSILDPGETWTYTANRTVAVGQQTTTGSVSGVYNGGNISSSDSANYLGALPSIDIQTRVSGQDADTPTGPVVFVSGSVVLSYIVTNTGSVSLQDVVVVDDRATPGNPGDDITLSSPSGDTNGNNLLDPGESWTYIILRTVAAGQQTTTGSVTATDVFNNLVQASNPGNYFGASANISVATTINGNANGSSNPTLTVGDSATFEYLVTNSGNVPLTDVFIVDDNGTPIVGEDDFIPTWNGDPNENGQLDVGETWSYTAIRTVIAGQYNGTVTVLAEDALGSADGTAAINYFGQAAPPTENADFDDSGLVDILDYVLWRLNNGVSSGATQGDANGDGAANDDDYNIWAGHYGSEPGGGGEAAAQLEVFEPVAAVMVDDSASEEAVANDAAFGLLALRRTNSPPGILPRTRSSIATAKPVDWTTMLNVLAERRSAGRLRESSQEPVSIDACPVDDSIGAIAVETPTRARSWLRRIKG